MSTLHRAIIRAYTAGTHKADVQLVGSLPTLITAVPVATKLDTVVVVPAVNFTVFGAFMVKVLKVLEPVKVIIPVEVDIVKLL